MDSSEYRQIIGAFATGVTVITTRVGEQLHGMTANAVTSVSLEPLLLLVCVDREAICHRQLVHAERFTVNVLAADQEAISEAFARPQEPTTGGWPGLPHRLTTDGAPVLEGCLAHLGCRVTESYPGGDHTIFVGEVLEGRLERPDDPLLYFRGRYRRLSGD